MLPGTFGYRKPPSRRHDERRGGMASARFREAFDGPVGVSEPLASEAAAALRQRRDRAFSARQARRGGRDWSGILVALLIAAFVAALVWGAVAKLGWA